MVELTIDNSHDPLAVPALGSRSESLILHGTGKTTGSTVCGVNIYI